jgi:major vault protein
MVRTEGAYLRGVFEEIVQTTNAVILHEKKALHLRARRKFVDFYGIERKGPSSFLLPGERLEAGIQEVHVFDSEEALLLRAREEFKDGEELRHPGDRWMIYGPSDFVPTVSVEIIEKRRSIPLDENEGIYVRDMKTGRVRAVSGKVYKLTPYEELWDKELPEAVEELLTLDADQASGIKEAGATRGARTKSRVVTYKIPHNSAVQIYDYKAKEARVLFGPNLIMLGPDESFTVLSLSGSTPKKPKALNVIALLLGPRFSTDVVVVETADHARLSLKLSYNWYFDIDRKNSEQAAALFSVPDFIGDFCKAIASRVRGSVAAQTFDHFHKNSADLIRGAVFGTDEKGQIRNRFFFKANNLVITNIDIQSVEPVDQRTRDALQKSVQLAIEITTKSQEASARHEAERREQEARGRLERQKNEDEGEAEKARKELLQLQAHEVAVESTGSATAEAKARSEAAKIEGEAGVKAAELNSEAATIKAEAALKKLKAEQAAEISHKRSWNALEIEKSKELADIEAHKFKAIVDAIGASTLKKIANSGPEMQVRLLQGLGLKSFMITDGNTPINLSYNLPMD